MKLLFCPMCHDVKGLVLGEWRMCLCGASGGQYNKDGMTATIGGQARVFGVGNPFFEFLYPYLEEKGLKRMQKDLYGHEKGDCWWGEYEGDRQLFRIESALGPRLKIHITPQAGGNNYIIILDKRKVTIAGKELKSVLVPANPQVPIKTRWRYNAKKSKSKYVQSSSKDRGRRPRRNSGKRDAPIRPGQDRTTSTKNVKDGESLVEQRSTSSNLHGKDEPAGTHSGKVEGNSLNDQEVLQEIFRQGPTSDSREVPVDKKILGR